MNDSLPLRRVDHVHFFVGNARQSAYFYRNAFGFEVVAYSGLETGNKNEAAYVLKQGEITLVLTSPLRADHPENSRLMLHGDGVKDVALEVDNVEAAFNTAVSRGAIPKMPPTSLEDEHGIYPFASIQIYGDTTHTFVNRDNYRGVFMPGFQPLESERYQSHRFLPAGLKAIDHIVGNVELGHMNEWVGFYEKVMGFSQLVHFDEKDISTEYTALMSKVVQGGDGRIKFPLNEPADGIRKSQIEEYLEFYGSPGVQHIALATDDIMTTVRNLRANDVSFLRVPETYYDVLPDRVGAINESYEEIAELGLLVDKDDEGYLLQIFTQARRGSPDHFLRDHSAARLAFVRQRQFQGHFLRLSNANKNCAGRSK